LKVFQTVAEIQKYLLEINSLRKNQVGFVPTMGALHEGHLSLIRESKLKADTTVSSIFVNPTQFNDKSDFDKYPIQLDTDLEMLLEAACDVVFVPSVKEIYPDGIQQKADVPLGFLGTTLEAAHRPGHFEGVMQVVKRLLDIVQPDILFIGQKDFQQCLVIARLIEHYHLPIQLEICETKREGDGLAMSSRNARLSPEERASAVKLSQALFYIKKHLHDLPIATLIEERLQWLAQDERIRTEYLAVVNGKTLAPITEIKEDEPAVALIAAKVGEVRLIDNIRLPD
jgi:pantoate--beta-alanine ligase